MLLLDLPSEILIQIFGHIDSSYFRSDLSRLTVSKAWHIYAYAVYFRDLRIDQKKLQRLASSPLAWSSISQVNREMKHLDLHLDDSLDLGADSMFQPNLAVAYALRLDWKMEYNRNLLFFAGIIEQVPRLHHLRIQAVKPITRLDYLFPSTVHALLSPSNLTRLELDLCGVEDSFETGNKIHLCASIAEHLSVLQYLRLRMHLICADILKVRQQDTVLRLHTIIVNLSVASNRSISHAQCCDIHPGGLSQLQQDLVEQAQILTTQMAAPRMVRILRHTRSSTGDLPRVLAFDVLTGETLELSEGEEWDENGTVIEEQVPDDRSEISSGSSDE